MEIAFGICRRGKSRGKAADHVDVMGVSNPFENML